MPHPTWTGVVRHPDVDGLMVPIDPAIDYDPSDPVVKKYAWAFAPLEESGIVDYVEVEQATAAPGEKRPRRTKPAG